MPKKEVRKNQPKYVIQKYSVVQVYDENEVDEREKLFECIPDIWFVDGTRNRARWPPTTGTSFSLRAIRCEKPDDSWNVYEVRVISEGHLTYNSGFKIVREKCNQKYNTSSAEEQIDAANFRRKHPVLSMQNEGSGSIEHLFVKPNETSKGKTNKSAVTDVSSIQTSSKQRSMEALPNSDIGIHERGQSELDLSLNCDNKNHSVVDDDIIETAAVASPLNRSRSSHRRSTDTQSGTASPSNQSRFSHRRSPHTPSSAGSPSNQSRSSHRRSTHTPSSTSDSNFSRSSKSPRSTSSGSKRSNLIRSRSSYSLQSRSPSKKRRSSNESFRSGSTIDNIRRLAIPSIPDPVPSIRKPMPLIRKQKNNAKTGNSTSAFKSNDPKLANKHKKGSKARYSTRSRSIQSNCSNESRSRSNQNRQRSKSRSSYVRPKTNQNERRQSFQADNRKKVVRTGIVNSKSKNRAKRSTSADNRSRSSHRRSSSDYSRSRQEIRRSVKRKRNVKPKTKKHSERSKHRDHRSRSSHRRHSSHHSRSRSQSSEHDDDLINVVKKLNETISKNSQQLKDNDRRFHRMEVTMNKIFVLVSDLNGNAGIIDDELLNQHGFELPNLPIVSTNELTVMKRKLRDKEFRIFFLQHEKAFCCPTKRSTDTVTISKYLKRFIQLRVRCKITLKEIVDDGATLYNDYHSVYKFLIDVMIAGYKSCGKTITTDDAHSALRVVWGRSKQYYRDEQDRMER